jgi:hypothetical protein
VLASTKLLLRFHERNLQSFSGRPLLVLVCQVNQTHHEPKATWATAMQNTNTGLRFLLWPWGQGEEQNGWESYERQLEG